MGGGWGREEEEGRAGEEEGVYIGFWRRGREGDGVSFNVWDYAQRGNEETMF